MSKVKDILAKVNNLPAAPGVAQQVLALVGDPHFSFHRLMEVIRVDTGITANVLRICNSPFYGLRHKVSSLEQAITYLGSNQVLDIVLSSEMVGLYRRSVTGYELERGELWRHSMATALLTQKLGAKLGFGQIPTLFTAALLHDVGKLILSEYVQEKFQEIERLVRGENKSFVEAEKMVLGVDHAVLGGLAARNWNFPELISQVIAFHHQSEKAVKYRREVSLVSLANLLVLSLGVGGGAAGLAAPVPPGLLEEVGVKAREIPELTLELKDIFDQADDLLSMAQ